MYKQLMNEYLLIIRNIWNVPSTTLLRKFLFLIIMFFFPGTLNIMFFNNYIFIKMVNNLLNVFWKKKKNNLLNF